MTGSGHLGRVIYWVRTRQLTVANQREVSGVFQLLVWLPEDCRLGRIMAMFERLLFNLGAF